MDFERVANLFKRKGKPEPPTTPPPDPVLEFPHPENRSLFARFKENSKAEGPDTRGWTMGGYEVRVHPDLIEILYDLVSEGQVKKGCAYGKPVVATSGGLVFAYAGGTHSIFFKLHQDRFDAARLDGGRYDPTYGTDWIEFQVGGRIGGPPDWHGAMRRWARISYQDCLALES